VNLRVNSDAGSFAVLLGVSKNKKQLQNSVADWDNITNLVNSMSPIDLQSTEPVCRKIIEIISLYEFAGSTWQNEIICQLNNLEAELINLKAIESKAREYADFVIKEMQLRVDLAILAQQEQAPNLVLNFLQF
jgi:hypothetical protein